MTSLLTALICAVISADADGGTELPAPVAVPAEAPAAAPSGPADAPAPALAPKPPALLVNRSIVEEEITPTLRIYSGDGLEMKVGGTVQVQAALYVGPDALITNGDIASNPGFRVRRAGFGLEGQLGNHLGALIAINALNIGPDVSLVGDARLTWGPASWLNLSIGSGKVPFSRGALVASSSMLALERPMSVNQITPSRRIGLTAEGQLLDGRLVYLAGVMNGTDGFVLGNTFGGYLLGARLEGTPWGRPKAGVIGTYGISLGVDVVRDQGPGVGRTAVSGDVLFGLAGFTVQLEVLWDRGAPTQAPTVPPAVSAQTDRLGFYSELGYTFMLGVPWQLTARGEYYDDNTHVDDAGDVLLVSGGVNARVYKDYARVQLQYVWRKERHGEERNNDVLAFSVQGNF